MTETWVGQTCSCHSNPRCANGRLVTSWRHFRHSTRGAGSGGIHFSLLCGCEGWNAMPPAVMPKRSTAARQCCELKRKDGHNKDGVFYRSSWHCENTMKDLKEKTIRGGLARLCAQGANFF